MQNGAAFSTHQKRSWIHMFFFGKYSDLQLRTIQAVQQIFINLSSNVNLSRIGMIGEFEVTSWITAIFRCVFLWIYIRSMVSIPSSLDFIKAQRLWNNEAKDVFWARFLRSSARFEPMERFLFVNLVPNGKWTFFNATCLSVKLKF